MLHGLDFTVKQGETIALVGESGSGKTTILNMLIGFILPSGGQLMLDGKDMKGLNLRTYRRFLSVVPQTRYCLPERCGKILPMVWNM